MNILTTNRLTAFFGLFALASTAKAQEPADTITRQQLDQVTVVHNAIPLQVYTPDKLHGSSILAARRAEIIPVGRLNADPAANLSRQLFSRTPGIQSWENDGSGIQTGIAARGLSPNRSWEFNVRQNGTDIAPDVFGYPEAYYTPPAEAVSTIELVRGAASLQFGPQFGGLLNYVIRKGDSDKKISVDARQTVGSYGLFNSYTGVGGTYGKVNYYAWFHYRRADGWRENSGYATRTGYVNIDYRFTERTILGFTYTSSYYKSQQPGGLTDQQFETDAQSSTRERNWFSAPWNLFNLQLKHQLSENSSIDVKVFANKSQRNSVGFLKAINIPDTINSVTHEFAARQVDRDAYESIGAEIRWIQHYSLLGKKVTGATGIRSYHCNTERRQQGTGTTGKDFDLSTTGQFGRELQFGTTNYAAFTEQLVQITEPWLITLGARMENIQSTSEGRIAVSDGAIESLDRSRQFVLLSAGSSYQFYPDFSVYANYSQSYRPVTYSELTPSATSDIIDPNMKDANGYTAELGARGRIGRYVRMDATLFLLNYNDRIGTLSQNGTNFRTNIGDSRSAGVEWYTQYDVLRKYNQVTTTHLQVFASLSLLNGTYTRWNNTSANVEGNRMENAPWYNHHVGIMYLHNNWSFNLQHHVTGMAFSDAGNTREASANGQNGIIPAYNVTDFSVAYKMKKIWSFQTGVNNLTDQMYFTRRAGGYPGPGILPGIGRTWFVSVGVKV